MSKIIKGKKVGPDAIAGDIKSLGKSGVGLQKEALAEFKRKSIDAGEVARRQSAIASRFARSGAEDQQRALQGQLARKGLGSSSVGLGAASDITRRTGERLQAIGASEADREQAERERQIGRRFDLGARLVRQRGPIKFTTTRKGGLGAALGAAAGAAIGGPAGAQIGGSIGKSLQES